MDISLMKHLIDSVRFTPALGYFGRTTDSLGKIISAMQFDNICKINLFALFCQNALFRLSILVQLIYFVVSRSCVTPTSVLNYCGT